MKAKMERKVAEKQIRATGKATSKAEEQLESFRAKRELAEAKMQSTMAQKQEALDASKAGAVEAKGALKDVKDQMKNEMAAARVLEKEVKAKQKEIAVVEEEAKKAVEQKLKVQQEIEDSNKFKSETAKKAEEVHQEIVKLQSEMKGKEQALVGVETAAMKAERDAAHAELSLKANLMDREDLILERVGLKAVQVNWAQIGEAEGQRPDDLSRIQGLDEFAQQKLNVLGIHTYEQISKMDPVTAEVVNDAMEFTPGRISKMMWMQQAAQLMYERGR
jgi:predicted flap endonuclease-1-like 5' DNA nuclease